VHENLIGAAWKLITFFTGFLRPSRFGGSGSVIAFSHVNVLFRSLAMVRLFHLLIVLIKKFCISLDFGLDIPRTTILEFVVQR
jgi:hypothetical protein